MMMLLWFTIGLCLGYIWGRNDVKEDDTGTGGDSGGPAAA